jgi:hypothetical protein
MKNLFLIILTITSILYGNSQEIIEPEFTYQVNFLKLEKEFSEKLESQVPKAKMNQVSNKYLYEVKGAQSATRISSSDKPTLVVNMNGNSSDIEGLIYIFKMESTKNKRKSSFKYNDPSGNDNYIKFNYEKYGIKSYKITFPDKLEEGEYMIAIFKDDSKKLILFGIDK